MPKIFFIFSEAPTSFLAYRDLCSDSGITFNSDSHCKLFRELMEELMFFLETLHLKDTRLGFRTLLLNASILVHIVVFWCIQMFLDA